MSENENEQPIAEPSEEASATPPSAEATPAGGTTATESAAPLDAGVAVPSAPGQPPAVAVSETTRDAGLEAPKAEGDPSADATPDATEGDAPKGAAQEAGGEGVEGKKKRKRRRKKKKKEVADKKDQAFARFFEGSGPRQHAFRVGEVVAGRVTRVEDGAIVLDLFGKAIAIADVLEPREIAESPGPEATDPAAVSVRAPIEGAAAREAAAPGEVGAETPAADAVAHPPGAVAAPPSAAAAAEAPGPEAKSETPMDASGGAADSPMDASGEAADSPMDASGAAGAETSAELKAGTSPEPAKEEPAIEPIPLEPEPPHPEPPQVGAIFRGRVGAIAESGHIAIVNRNIERPRAKAAIKLAHDEKRRVPGVVFGYNHGGFDVLVAGIRCFAPARGMSLGMIDDPEALVGRKFEFSVPKAKGKSIVVTRRSILEKEARKAARDRLDELKVGEKLTGKVTDVRDYGALVDIGGVDGLVHMSEIAWARGGKPSDHVAVGDEVQVEVLKVQKMSRKDRYGKVSLSIRSCLPDPWDTHAELLQLGQPRKGKVVSLTEFGAFLELAPGIEGLLHISELDGKPAHAKDVLSEGEELDVVIDRKDAKQRRLSLSLLTPADLEAIEKGELDLAAAPRSARKGDLVTVVVERVERHGLLVQVKGLIGKRGRGYVPMRELPEEGETKKRFSQGSEHEMKVIGTDRDGRLRLSVKGKLRDEERKAVQQYRKEAASRGFGTFGDLLKSKLEK